MGRLPQACGLVGGPIVDVDADTPEGDGWHADALMLSYAVDGMRSRTVEVQATLLAMTLRHRFGPLPPCCCAVLRVATPRDLAEVALRMQDAVCWPEVFGCGCCGKRRAGCFFTGAARACVVLPIPTRCAASGPNTSAAAATGRRA